MTGRNPLYNVRHTTHPSRKPALHPSQRSYEPLQQPEPLTREARIASYAKAGRNTRTPAQRRRLAAKAHRFANRPARVQAAEQRRSQLQAIRQQAADAHLLGRVVQLPVARWATSAKAAMRSGHRG